MIKDIFIIEKNEITNKIVVDDQSQYYQDLALEHIDADGLRYDIGWVRSGDVFINPVQPEQEQPPTQDEALEAMAEAFISKGTSLYQDLKKKIWTVNAVNKMQGNDLTYEQMTQLLQTSDQLQKTLEGGALETASVIIGALEGMFPQYAQLAAWALNEINVFLAGQ